MESRASPLYSEDADSLPTSQGVDYRLTGTYLLNE